MKHNQEDLKEYCNKMFLRAIGTKTNRPKAEKWARRIIGVNHGDYQIHWCKSPAAVAWMVKSLGSPSRRDWYLWCKLWVELLDRLKDSLQDNLTHADTLQAVHFVNIMGPLWGNLWNDLLKSRRDSLWDDLWESLWDSLRNSRWIAVYSYAEKAGLASFTKEDSGKLKAWRKLMKHCFTIYAYDGHVILVDRPVEVKVENGNLVDIKFG